MRDIYPQLKKWHENNRPIVMATVVQVYGSAPRPLGSKMIITDNNSFAGSVSGGCVEGAVIREANQILKNMHPKLLSYGISNDTAWDLGLACGGKIQVFLELLCPEDKCESPLSEIYPKLSKMVENDELCAVATIISGESAGKKILFTPSGIIAGNLVDEKMNNKVLQTSTDNLSSQQPFRYSVKSKTGEVEIFVDVIPPHPRLIIIGAVHIATPLVALARIAGFHTTVIDSRSAFATRERFPDADELFADWPADVLARLSLNEGTYLAFLSHDEKMDIPALQVALESSARYIGALGSSKTNANRVQMLLDLNIPRKQINRIHAPIGLPIGSASAEDIAFSIVSEMIAIRNGKA
jgi:xanthine dehydrogenase accessory factor